MGRVRIAVIDSGVNPRHPHIGRIAGGFPTDDYLDVLGHGTAVMAAIQEKAPEAEYYAVRVFRNALRTNIDALVQALEWCLDNRMDVVNLSLGTPNLAHQSRFEPVVARAAEQGLALVSALHAGGCPCLPGSLPAVFGVDEDPSCGRDRYRCRIVNGRVEFLASGYPRPIPGVPAERNLQGISFAVANMTGFVVRCCEALDATRDLAQIEAALAAAAESLA